MAILMFFIAGGIGAALALFLATTTRLGERPGLLVIVVALLISISLSLLVVLSMDVVRNVCAMGGAA